MDNEKGTSFVPFFYLLMHTEALEASIIDVINQLLNEEPEYFLVDCSIQPVNDIKIFIDGDNGVSINKCAQWNRIIYKKIEENNWFTDGNFSLEISSPGIDRPLKLDRQYRKNIGKLVEVIEKTGQKTEGFLENVSDTTITLKVQEGKGKKAIQKNIDIAFNNIKTTTVQIIF